MSEKRLSLAFGRRLFDEAVIRKYKSVARLKVWGGAVFIFAGTRLLESAEAARINTTAQATVNFDGAKSAIAQEMITVRPLIDSTPRPADARSGKSERIAPIQVLSFAHATEIPPGAEAKAVLLTGATNGLIKARLSEPVKVDGITLIESGTLLLGEGRSTEERLYVDFKKAVFRDGKSIPISAQAYEQTDSIVGLKGSRVGDASLKLAASSGLYFLSGLAGGLQDQGYDGRGRPRRSSTRDAALNGVSRAAGENAKEYMENLKNRAPVIEVKSGTTFIVTFDGGV